MNIGIILNNLSFSELNYKVVSEINRYVETTTDGVSILCDNISNRLIEPNCAVVDTALAPSITEGVLIAFDLSGALTLRRAYCPAKKLLFVWNLEWVYSNLGYNTLYDTLTDENIELITRNEAYSRVIENAVGRRPKFLLEDFTMEKIYEICRAA